MTFSFLMLVFSTTTSRRCRSGSSSKRAVLRRSLSRSSLWAARADWTVATRELAELLASFWTLARTRNSPWFSAGLSRYLWRTCSGASRNPFITSEI
uniref:Putative secreted protein n=1 Tax=Ixodes ricinus TaxID=34613 RepID=A0A6B0UHX9_IXORI